MTPDQRAALRTAVAAVDPTAEVRFHGTPTNAPSVHFPREGCAFRAWNRVYVSILTSSPDVVAAVAPWDAGRGWTWGHCPDGCGHGAP